MTQIRALKITDKIYLEVYGEGGNHLQLKMYTGSGYRALVATGVVNGVNLPEKELATW